MTTEKKAERIALVKSDDGAWRAPCGCRFSYLGEPYTIAWGIRRRTVVEPHWHPCELHAEAEAEIGLLQENIRGMTELDPIFLSKIKDEMKILVGVPQWATAMFVDSFAETLGSAPNYMEITVRHKDKAFVVTLQRKEGKTPHQARMEAEGAALMTRKALQDLYDWQNGPPLPSYEQAWSAAMKQAETVLGTPVPAMPPLPMVLHCPECKQQHIDVGEFATRPHRTHRCTAEAGNGPGCGHEWRPALVRTVGVKELPDG